MNNSIITFNSGINPQSAEERVCKNVIEIFGNAMINHDVSKLKELYNDFYANILGNFHNKNVIEALSKMCDMLFEMDWNDWSDEIINQYLQSLSTGSSNRLLSKYA